MRYVLIVLNQSVHQGLLLCNVWASLMSSLLGWTPKLSFVCHAASVHMFWYAQYNKWAPLCVASCLVIWHAYFSILELPWKLSVVTPSQKYNIVCRRQSTINRCLCYTDHNQGRCQKCWDSWKIQSLGPLKGPSRCLGHLKGPYQCLGP